MQSGGRVQLLPRGRQCRGAQPGEAGGTGSWSRHAARGLGVPTRSGETSAFGHRGSCPGQDGAERTPLPLVHGVAVVSRGLKTLSPGQGQRPLPGNYAPRSARVTRSGPAASAPSRGGGPPSDTL